jgi:hypothetical protein
VVGHETTVGVTKTLEYVPKVWQLNVKNGSCQYMICLSQHFSDLIFELDRAAGGLAFHSNFLSAGRVTSGFIALMHWPGSVLKVLGARISNSMVWSKIQPSMQAVAEDVTKWRCGDEIKN